MATKDRERFYVEQAARLLGATWGIGPDRESPDFVISDGASTFGLEVSMLFTGQQSAAGSAVKKSESKTQKAIQNLRLQYEAIHNVPLAVKFVGRMCEENLAKVVPSLIAEDLPSKPVGHHLVVDTNNGLRVHVTRGFRPEWYSVNDRVGWVDRNPVQKIADAIEEKATRLEQYKAAVGSDIRLLLVADQFLNSGKMRLEQKPDLDKRGFDAIYFLAYPESVIVFD
ncbi:MAG: hypothetical protein KIT48_04545 [Pseudolabrys sp.]|nr:hypothetical protein [Pseudolabrys sp.]